MALGIRVKGMEVQMVFLSIFPVKGKERPR